MVAFSSFALNFSFVGNTNKKLDQPIFFLPVRTIQNEMGNFCGRANKEVVTLPLFSRTRGRWLFCFPEIGSLCIGGGFFSSQSSFSHGKKKGNPRMFNVEKGGGGENSSLGKIAPRLACKMMAVKKK